MKQLIEKFVAELQADSYKPSTITYYSENLTAYLNWYNEVSGVLWHEKETVRRFLNREKRRGLSPYTLVARHTSLNRFFKWLIQRGEVGGNPMVDIKRAKTTDVEVRSADRNEVLRLIDSIALGNRWIDRRDEAILRLMIDCGLRRGEVVLLSEKSFDFDRGVVTIPPFKHGGERQAALLTATMEKLRAYIEVRPEFKGPFFISSNGAGGPRGPMQGDAIRQMLQRRCAAAGIDYMNPHSLRHSSATHMINSGMREESIEKVLGHKDLRQTKLYARLMPDTAVSEARALLESAEAGPHVLILGVPAPRPEK